MVAKTNRKHLKIVYWNADGIITKIGPKLSSRKRHQRVPHWRNTSQSKQQTETQ